MSRLFLILAWSKEDKGEQQCPTNKAPCRICKFLAVTIFATPTLKISKTPDSEYVSQHCSKGSQGGTTGLAVLASGGMFPRDLDPVRLPANFYAVRVGAHSHTQILHFKDTLEGPRESWEVSRWDGRNGDLLWSLFLVSFPLETQAGRKTGREHSVCGLPTNFDRKAPQNSVCKLTIPARRPPRLTHVPPCSQLRIQSLLLGPAGASRG